MAKHNQITPPASPTIIITGGAGFLCTHLIKELYECGYDNVVIARSEEYDLRNCDEIIRVFNTAARMLFSNLYNILVCSAWVG
jgi:nucleoside-diphosphate-sugar epimerase